MTYTTSNCGSCRAAVIWAESERGTRMPVDAEPSADGSVDLRERPGQPPLAVVIAATKRSGHTSLRTSHFATCPDAASWRKRRVLRN